MANVTIDPSDFAVHLDWPVQWGDQDMFGHVNNTIYFRWFESARVEYLERIGMSAMSRREMVLGPILASVTCNFRRQVTFPDTVRIGTRVSRIGKTSMTIDHGIWSTAGQGALVADGTSTVVVFDYQSQRPTRVPDEIRQRIEAIEGKRLSQFDG